MLPCRIWIVPPLLIWADCLISLQSSQVFTQMKSSNICQVPFLTDDTDLKHQWYSSQNRLRNAVFSECMNINCSWSKMERKNSIPASINQRLVELMDSKSQSYRFALTATLDNPSALQSSILLRSWLSCNVRVKTLRCNGNIPLAICV